MNENNIQTPAPEFYLVRRVTEWLSSKLRIKTAKQKMANSHYLEQIKEKEELARQADEYLKRAL